MYFIFSCIVKLILEMGSSEVADKWSVCLHHLYCSAHNVFYLFLFSCIVKLKWDHQRLPTNGECIYFSCIVQSIMYSICYHLVKLTPCNYAGWDHNVFYLFMHSPVDI